MNEEKFDVIVVGGGLAGSAAALVLAQNGLEVLVLDRGRSCGSKNVSGGRIYGHSLNALIPELASKAPIERTVVKERLSLLTDSSAFTMEYNAEKLKDEPSTSYTVLRAKFDRWLAKQAEDAGALYVLGTRVDDLLFKDDKVVGVSCNGEEVFAQAVILADGVNSLLAQQAGLKRELNPSQVAVGVKEVIKLGEKTINERFGVAAGEGVAWMFAGHPTDGSIGGGFLYTNRDSISIGSVATLSEIGRNDTTIPAMIQRLKEHPNVKPLLQGGTLLEYAAHLVPEAGLNMMPSLYGNGVMVVGDAAGFVINLGYMVRGMDFALESGRLAGMALVKAAKANDYSASSLSVYRHLLDDSFVMRDLNHYRVAPEFMENRLLFETLPQLADEAMGSLFMVNNKPPERMVKKMRRVVAKNGGFMPLLKMSLKARRAL